MKSLGELLKRESIKKIVSIDDGWDLRGTLSKKVTELDALNEISIGDYCKSVSINIKEEQVDCEDIKLIDLESIKEKAPGLYADITDALGLKEDYALAALEEALISTKDGDFTIKKVADINNAFKEDENVLYILDRDMGGSGYAKDDLLEWIVNILEPRKGKYNDLIIIYSNEVNDLISYDKKLSYIETSAITGDKNGAEKLTILYHFWPVKKENDVEKVRSEVTEALQKAVYGDALSDFMNIKRKAMMKAFDEMLSFNIDDLSDVMKGDYIEGSCILETYDTAIESIIKREESKYLSDSKLLEQAGQLMDYECEWIFENCEKEGTPKYSQIREGFDKKQLERAQETSLMLHNIADYNINQKVLDPSNGDLFWITSPEDKNYVGMIITQQCNTVIRVQGKDKSIHKRKVERFMFLLFEPKKITESFIKEKKNKKVNELDIYPIEYENNIYFLECLKQCKFIDCKLVDLCCVNSLGIAEIKPTMHALNLKNYHSRKYYKTIEKQVAQIIQEVDTSFIPSESAEYDALKNKIISYSIGVKFEDGKLEIKRICRLNKRKAAFISTSYLYSVGKLGNEVNLMI